MSAADGLTLAGEDSLEAARGAPADAPYALRFHLHPAVQPALEEDGAGVRLTLQNGSVWRFEASGLPLEVEESLFFASPEGMRRTSQIVVRTNAAAVPSIAWTFRKSRKS